ncbi:hypothetical protein [Pedobacter sp. MW01-1-1]|uniref:hypothetical protein n=1 Tax=Pedobacter sp. MW01-1-1 TaxID=3383027 RepID=UPI003FEE4D63
MIKIYKHTFLLSTISVLLFSCTASKYGTNGKAVPERVTMAAKNQPDVVDFAGILKKQLTPTLASRGQAKGRGLATNISTSLIGLGASAVKQMIAKEKKKYTAEWNNGLNNLYFYDQLSTQGPFDPVGLQFNGFKLERKILTKKGDSTLAMLLDVELATDTTNVYEMFNNAVFKLKVKDLQLNYSKAKVPASKNTLNVDIEITFNTSYVNQSGNLFKNVELGKFYLRLRNAPLDKSKPDYDAFYKKLKGKMLEGWSFLVPRSYGYHLNNSNQMEESWSQAAYSIGVKVTESSKNTFVNQLLIDNSESLINMSTDKLKKEVGKLTN